MEDFCILFFTFYLSRFFIIILLIIHSTINEIKRENVLKIKKKLTKLRNQKL
jgi:hypothetical protein